MLLVTYLPPYPITNTQYSTRTNDVILKSNDVNLFVRLEEEINIT